MVGQLLHGDQFIGRQAFHRDHAGGGQMEVVLVILWTLPPDTWLARFATNNYKRYEDNYD